jgi:UDP-N-acetylmuramyl pentapeptide phosphotransferase/UDP-N-acetylglucosamine-1-phosphate transferase
VSVHPLRRVAAAVAAGLTTGVVRGVLDAQAPGGQGRWTRSNHRGEPISMLEGPAVAAGLLAGSLVGAPTGRAAAALGVATAAGAAFGIVDDLAEDADAKRKGLRGHLGAMARGEVTTGGLKVLGIGAGALVAAALAVPGRDASGAEVSRGGRLLDVATSGALIAAGANLLNLLDLRPGRALKAATLVAGPLALGAGAGAGGAAAVLGASGAAFDQDLAETDMLGDGGANALGAALGAALVLSAPRRVRLAALGVVVGLTVASEKVSFTRVIERTPVLRELDALGRRPVHAAPGSSTSSTGAA